MSRCLNCKDEACEVAGVCFKELHLLPVKTDRNNGCLIVCGHAMSPALAPMPDPYWLQKGRDCLG